MKYTCPACGADSLRIIGSLELPPDGYTDELTLQLVQCGGCEFRAAAAYEESRHGVLNSESWQHTGYRLSDADWQALAEMINRCPLPSDKYCNCAAYLALNKMDNHYTWDGLRLNGLKIDGQFKMQRI